MLRWQVCTLTGHAGWVECIAFSSDGKCIVSGSTDGLVKIWDAGTGAEVRFFACVCWGGGWGAVCGGFMQAICSVI